MTASDRFMKKVSDYYNDLGYPVTWEGEGSKRSLEIQFKAESGYFTSMIFPQAVMTLLSRMNGAENRK